jgi:hypothetical protein
MKSTEEALLAIILPFSIYAIDSATGRIYSPELGSTFAVIDI